MLDIQEFQIAILLITVVHRIQITPGIMAYQPPCSQGPGAKLYTFTLYALSASPTLTVLSNQITGAVLTDALSSVTLGTATLKLSYTRLL